MKNRTLSWTRKTFCKYQFLVSHLILSISTAGPEILNNLSKLHHLTPELMLLTALFMNTNSMQTPSSLFLSPYSLHKWSSLYVNDIIYISHTYKCWKKMHAEWYNYTFLQLHFAYFLQVTCMPLIITYFSKIFKKLKS